jgi:hypothetical protein
LQEIWNWYNISLGCREQDYIWLLDWEFEDVWFRWFKELEDIRLYCYPLCIWCYLDTTWLCFIKGHLDLYWSYWYINGSLQVLLLSIKTSVINISFIIYMYSEEGLEEETIIDVYFK